MVLTAHIVSFQAVLVFLICDFAVHVLIKDVLEAGYLRIGKPQLELGESVFKGLARDASGIGVVTNAVEGFRR